MCLKLNRSTLLRSIYVIASKNSKFRFKNICVIEIDLLIIWAPITILKSGDALPLTKVYCLPIFFTTLPPLQSKASTGK